MDLEQLATFKAQLGDNAELISAFNAIESDVKNLNELKSTTVNKEKDLRGFKQQISETFGVQEGLSLEDTFKRVSEKNSEYQTKINSLTASTSGKGLELAEMKEMIANSQQQLNTLTSELNGERETNKLNSLKSEFRKQLSENGIKGVDQQNLVIGNHLSALAGVEDFGALASKVATENPYLTSTAHKGGAGTVPVHGQTKTNGLADIKIKDKSSRLAVINQMIANNPNKG